MCIKNEKGIKGRKEKSMENVRRENGSGRNGTRENVSRENGGGEGREEDVEGMKE